MVHRERGPRGTDEVDKPDQKSDLMSGQGDRAIQPFSRGVQRAQARVADWKKPGNALRRHARTTLSSLGNVLIARGRSCKARTEHAGEDRVNMGSRQESRNVWNQVNFFLVQNMQSPIWLLHVGHSDHLDPPPHSLPMIFSPTDLEILRAVE